MQAVIGTLPRNNSSLSSGERLYLMPHGSSQEIRKPWLQSLCRSACMRRTVFWTANLISTDEGSVSPAVFIWVAVSVWPMNQAFASAVVGIVSRRHQDGKSQLGSTVNTVFQTEIYDSDSNYWTRRFQSFLPGKPVFLQGILIFLDVNSIPYQILSLFFSQVLSHRSVDTAEQTASSTMQMSDS